MYTQGFHQHPGQQQYPPAGGYPAGGNSPQPPKKTDPKLIAALVAAVTLVLGTLGVTGFVAPGFFLSDGKATFIDEKGDPTSSPEALADRIVEEIANKNPVGLDELKCDIVDLTVEVTIAKVANIDSVERTGEIRTIHETEAETEMTMTVNGLTRTVTGTMIKEYDRWCLHKLQLDDAPAPPPAGPGVSVPPAPSGAGEVPQKAKTLIEDFIAKVNDGDKAGALELTCPKTGVDPLVSIVIDRRPRISVGDLTTNGPMVVSADLTGSRSDSPAATGSVGVLTEDEGATWCVGTFHFR